MISSFNEGDRRGRDRMVVGNSTTYAISAYHHYYYDFEHRSGEVYSIQHYLIKFVSDFRQVGVLVRKTTEILLKVALNTINKPNHYLISCLR